MSHSEHRVAIVVDPAFGDRLDALAGRMHVWVADTSANRAAAERFWATSTPSDLESGVTTLEVDLSQSPEEWCAGIVGTVKEHQGEFRLRAALAAHGFGDFESTSAGFRARSRPAS